MIKSNIYGVPHYYDTEKKSWKKIDGGGSDRITFCPNCHRPHFLEFPSHDASVGDDPDQCLGFLIFKEIKRFDNLELSDLLEIHFENDKCLIMSEEYLNPTNILFSREPFEKIARKEIQEKLSVTSACCGHGGVSDPYVTLSYQEGSFDRHIQIKGTFCRDKTKYIEVTRKIAKEHYAPGGKYERTDKE